MRSEAGEENYKFERAFITACVGVRIRDYNYRCIIKSFHTENNKLQVDNAIGIFTFKSEDFHFRLCKF